MNRLAELILCAAHLALLRAASWLVPSTQREEWCREWASELSNARLTCLPDMALSWAGALKLSRFCLGSFQDAICLRQMEPKPQTSSGLASDSATRCLLCLGVIVVFCTVLSCYLPGIRTEEDAARESPGAGVIFIRRAPSDQEISFREFQNWSSVHQAFFKNMAFYWTEELRAKPASGRSRRWCVAHISNDVFNWLAGELFSGSVSEEPDANLPRAVLSRSTWRTDFDSNPAVVGTTAWVAGRHVEIIGIAPDDTWRLPEKPDLWVLESDAQLARHSSGYIIAQLSPKGRSMMGSVARISAYTARGDEVDLVGATFTDPATGTISLYVFAFILAILAMPAVTSVFQSECEFASQRPSFRVKARGWIFLLAKFGMVAATGYFGAIDIAYCAYPGYSPSAQLIQVLCSFSICLVGFRWALVDQGRRCPVCLRVVTHPAQVGIASCNFLGWNGTEMVCMGGHVLLHVPNLPTSWFARQRWTYLDKSWEFLFATVPSHL